MLIDLKQTGISCETLQSGWISLFRGVRHAYEKHAFAPAAEESTLIPKRLSRDHAVKLISREYMRIDSRLSRVWIIQAYRTVCLEAVTRFSIDKHMAYTFWSINQRFWII